MQNSITSNSQVQNIDYSVPTNKDCSYNKTYLIFLCHIICFQLPYQKPKASNFGHKHIEENINQIIFS